MRGFITLAAVFCLVASATAQNLVITELMATPSINDADGEWFELYNPTAQAVDMDGWTFRDSDGESYTVVGSLSIAPGAWMVLGVNGNSSQNGGVTVQHVYSGLSFDSADELILEDELGNVVDSVGYDGGSNWPDPFGASLALSDRSVDNSDGANWAEAVAPWATGSDYGSPGYANETAVLQFSSGTLDAFSEPWLLVYNLRDLTAIDLTIQIDQAVYAIDSIAANPVVDAGAASGWTSTTVDWDWSGGPVDLADDDIMLVLLGSVVGPPGSSVSFAVDPASSLTSSSGALPTLFISGDWSVPGTLAPDVVLSEIFQNPDGSDTDREWLELYNNDAATVDLQGWTFSSGGVDQFTLPSGAPIELPAGSSYLLAASGDSASNGAVEPDFVWPEGSFTLANGPDAIILSNASGTEIDRVEYDGGGHWPAPDGASMWLADPAADNNNGTNWSVASFRWSGDPLAGKGTPGRANDVAGLVIESGSYGQGEPHLRGYGLTDLTALSIVHSYEESAFEITGVTANPAFAGGLSTSFDTPAAGFVTHSYSGASISFAEGDTLLTLNGNVVGDPLAVSWYSPTDATLASSSSGAIPLQLAAGRWFVPVSVSTPISVAELQQNATLLAGDTVAVRAIAITGPGLLSTTESLIAVQDSSGYGLLVHNTDPSAFSAIQRGDSLLLEGEVDDSGEMTRLTHAALTVLGSAHALPAPLAVPSLLELASLSGHEGTRARARGTLLTDPGAAAGELIFHDGSASAMLRLAPGAALDLSNYAWGDSIEATALLSVEAGLAGLTLTAEDELLALGSAPQDTLLNGGFEEWIASPFARPAHFRVESYPDLLPDSASAAAQVHSGDRALTLTLPLGQSAGSVEQEYRGLGPGDLLELAVWAYDSDIDGSAVLSVQFRDATGGGVGAPLSSPASVDLSAWQELNLDAIVPTGAVQATVSLLLSADPAASGELSIHLDDLSAKLVPFLDVATVQLDTSTLGRRVRLAGVLTQSAFRTGDSTNACLQDTSGYGVHLYASNVDSSLLRGDSIAVIGRVEQAGGTTRLVEFTVQPLAGGVDLPAPIVVSSDSASRMLAREGSRVEVSGYIQNELQPASWTLLVDDGSGLLELPVLASTDIDLTALQRWGGVVVRGVLIAQADGSTALLPTEQEDIVPGPVLPPPSALIATADSASHSVELSWQHAASPNHLENLRYYGIYRDGVLSGSVATDSSYLDLPLDFGSFSYQLRAHYDAGVSAPTNVASAQLPHALWAPANLEHHFVEGTNLLQLTWARGGSFGENLEEIVLDSESWDGSYSWPGNTMAMHFSIPEAATLLAVRFMTAIAPGDQEFLFQLYDWDQATSMPQSTPLIEEMGPAADARWSLIDLRGMGLTVEQDFVVGFASLDSSATLAFEQGIADWDRTWDRVDGAWQQRMADERYGIRAIVQYDDGQLASVQASAPGRSWALPPAGPRSLHPWVDAPRAPDELDDLVAWDIFRNDLPIASIDTLGYRQLLATPGTYIYQIRAMYDEGFSHFAVDTVLFDPNAVLEAGAALPESFTLDAAWPNPFNPSLNLRIGLPERAEVNVRIYDLLGRQVAHLGGTSLQPGYHRLSWRPEGLASGLYFVRLQTPRGVADQRKVLYLK